jgi:ArsR family metal-binding transcriptional regulator
MTEPQSQWSEVSDRIEALALKLKLHLEQSQDSEEVTEALSRLRQSVQDAFDAAGTAVRDEAVRSDVRDVGRLLTDAVSTTLARVSEDIRDAFARKS